MLCEVTVTVTFDLLRYCVHGFKSGTDGQPKNILWRRNVKSTYFTVLKQTIECNFVQSIKNHNDYEFTKCNEQEENNDNLSTK